MLGKLGFLKMRGLVILAWGFCLGKNVCASTAKGLFRKKQSKMASTLTCNFDISYLISSLAEMSKYTRCKPSLKLYLYTKLNWYTVSFRIKPFSIGRGGFFLGSSLKGREDSSRRKMKMWYISNIGKYSLKELLQGGEGTGFKIGVSYLNINMAFSHHLLFLFTPI